MSADHRLEELYLIADIESAQRLSVDVIQVVRGFIGAGGRMVSLRGGAAPDDELMDVGREIGAMIYAAGGLFLIHRRLDLAQLLAADGVHLPARGVRVEQARRLLGPSALVGRSCHTAQEIQRADEEGVSFVTVGPIFESLSKEGYGPAFELDELKAVAEEVELPIYALGGVLPENGASCLLAGAYGVAVVGGILGAESAFEATKAYLEALRRRIKDCPSVTKPT